MKQHTAVRFPPVSGYDIPGLEGWISCFEKSRLAGVVRGTGADKKGAIEECGEALSAAYEMGRNV